MLRLLASSLQSSRRNLSLRHILTETRCYSLDKAFENIDEAQASIGDFRSDTVTRPSEPMRQVIADAVVGDDVMGEDATVNELERRVAKMMGKDAALLVSSGTMGNLVSIGATCGRGDELLTADKSHIQQYEAGGASVLLGVKVTTVSTGYGSSTQFGIRSSKSDGLILPEQVSAMFHGIDQHFAPTRMLCLENTNVTCGGNVISLNEMRGMKKELFLFTIFSSPSLVSKPNFDRDLLCLHCHFI